MRRVAPYLSIALLLAVPAVSLAQPRNPAPRKDQVIELDAESGVNMREEDPPAVPGQPTEEAAQAKALFETGKWAQAALALKKVTSGETGDDEGNKQLASFQLAICLYNMKLFVPSYSFFSEIARKQNHQKFAETLLWIARLAQKLPVESDVIETIGRYDDGEMLKRFDNAEQRPLNWQISYLLGRYKYRNGDLETALTRFKEVGAGSAYHAVSRFYAGLAYVRLRQGAMAREMFEAARASIAEGRFPRDPDDPLAELTTLNLARVNYSLAFRQRSEGDFEASTKLITAAIGYWDEIPLTSPFRADAFYERGLAHFATGDFGAALGDLESARSPLVQQAGLVQADAFEVEVYGSLCDRPAVQTLRANLDATYTPLRDGLRAYARARSTELGEAELYRDFAWLVRKPGTGAPSSLASLTPELQGELGRVVGKRELTHHLNWIDEIDAEMARFKGESEGFRSSDLGMDIVDALDLAREIGIRRAGAHVMKRIEARIAELEGAFQHADTIAKWTHAPVADPALFTVDRSSVTDDSGEYERWPVDGEVWADEVGSYRAVVVSKCPKL